ncbi:hypothetical protein GDO81_017871 [Engystomops pustulosus]|uniref:Uncharacterized protein n=1 Tax=Engystomops pustulosus TaxID=76066 RepID=A0AAV7A3L2_ENGPU|nr:hypothetical protein GDO81_017871 [Engystomops pustulosus]
MVPSPNWQQSPSVTYYSLLLIWQMFSSLCPYMKIASTYLPLPVQYSSIPDADSHKRGKTHPASTPYYTALQGVDWQTSPFLNILLFLCLHFYRLHTNSSIARRWWSS